MADETTDTTTKAQAVSAAVSRAHQGVLDRIAAGLPLGLPENFVRATLTMMLVLGMLWMQWHSPKEGAVPAGLVTLASGAAGYYLTQENTGPSMRAILSLLIVGVAVAFYVEYVWLPEALNSLVGMCWGVYFARREARTP